VSEGNDPNDCVSATLSTSALLEYMGSLTIG
jgi:hypothetical protein